MDKRIILRPPFLHRDYGKEITNSKLGDKHLSEESLSICNYTESASSIKNTILFEPGKHVKQAFKMY